MIEAGKKQATREAVGLELVKLGREDKNIVVLDADISKSTKTSIFAGEFPERFFNCGIAEQNMANIACGLSAAGKTVYMATYSVFSSMRACEQLRTYACYPGLKLTVLASHGGLTPGSDGPTHQAIEDIGILRSIPNMSVVMPADSVAAAAILRASLNWDGPLYIRMTRDAVPVFYKEGESFEIGRGKTVRDGTDISIIANGDMVFHALTAAAQLERRGISARVVDMHTIKPLDREAVLHCCRETGAIVTVEDHNIYNGLGSAVAEIVAEEAPVPFKRIGIRDTFAESGPYEELLKKYGLSADCIVDTAESIVRMKKSRNADYSVKTGKVD